MTRPTVRILITQDLGYCCEWFFFTRFKNTALIADRLGVTERAVRYAKARVKCGSDQCQGKPACMDKALTMKLTPRKTASA